MKKKQSKKQKRIYIIWADGIDFVKIDKSDGNVEIINFKKNKVRFKSNYNINLSDKCFVWAGKKYLILKERVGRVE